MIAAVLPADAQQPAVEEARIAETLFQLTDVIGPRVVGSPALRKAEVWLEQRLREYGVVNVRTEANAPMEVGGGVMLNPPGWSWSRLTVQQLMPWPQTLIGLPVLYSRATPGAVTGDVIVAPLPRPNEAEITAFIGKYKGRLRGTFLLLSDREAVIANPNALATGLRRYTASELKEMADAKVTPQPKSSPPKAGAPPPPNMKEVFAQFSRLYDFLRDEGVLGLIGPARSPSQGGTLIANAPPAPPTLTTPPPPMIDLTPEHFNRLLRLTQRGAGPVKLEVNLEATMHEPGGTANEIGEIRGSKRPDEVVMVGAHLDSWHGGTGATDNAAGVAAVLEAIRVLAAQKTPRRRTVRVAFWGGEEFGLVGSRAYIHKYLLDAQGKPTAEFGKISAYLNLDYGSGRIRGIYLQGNEALEPLFDQWLVGIGDGGLVATVRSTLGSDQGAFERAGIPGLSFIQDPLNYEQRTNHTSMDVSDYVVVSDVGDSAATLASVITKIANAEELLPRKKQ